MSLWKFELRCQNLMEKKKENTNWYWCNEKDESTSFDICCNCSISGHVKFTKLELEK